MDLRFELLSKKTMHKIAEKVIKIDIDVNEVVQTTAIEILEKIKKVVCDESTDDFEKIEIIVEIFNEYNIDANGCHDF